MAEVAADMVVALVEAAVSTEAGEAFTEVDSAAVDFTVVDLEALGWGAVLAAPGWEATVAPAWAEVTAARASAACPVAAFAVE